MITVLCPTVRPEVAYANAQRWMAAATNKAQVVFWFGVNTEADFAALAHAEIHTGMLDSRYSRMSLFKNARQGVTDTVTKMTRQAYHSLVNNKDIFVLASDDFSAPPGWDEHLQNQFGYEWDGALIINDGYKPETNIIPMPVVSGAVLKRLNGILYHPAYHHFYSDEELFYVATELKLVKNLRGGDAPKFEHKHWSFSGRRKDGFDERNQIKWDHDKAVYLKRKALSVEEKLKLPDWWAD